MNTATTTLTLNEGFLARRNWYDWLFAALVLAGGRGSRLMNLTDRRSPDPADSTSTILRKADRAAPTTVRVRK